MGQEKKSYCKKGISNIFSLSLSLVICEVFSSPWLRHESHPCVVRNFSQSFSCKISFFNTSFSHSMSWLLALSTFSEFFMSQIFQTLFRTVFPNISLLFKPATLIWIGVGSILRWRMIFWIVAKRLFGICCVQTCWENCHHFPGFLQEV